MYFHYGSHLTFIFCPLYVYFPVSAVCIGTYPGLHQFFLRVQVQNIGVAGCTETFHLSYRKIRPVNRVINNKRCTRTPIFILYNRVYLKDYLYQQKREAFLLTSSDAFKAIDFPQHLKTGMSVEPSPTATHSEGLILFFLQKSLTQFTLFSAFI